VAVERQHTAVERQVAVLEDVEVVVAVGPTEVVVTVGPTEVEYVVDLEAVGSGAVDWTFGCPWVVYAKAAVKPPSSSSTAAAVMICVVFTGNFIFLRIWVGSNRIYWRASRNWNS